MTSGEILQKKLGLEKLKNPRINRVVGLSKPTYMIWYDSSAPTRPITWSQVRRFPYIGSVRFGHDPSELAVMTPLVMLKNYNGDTKTSVFFTIDMAGYKLSNPKNVVEAWTPKVTMLSEFLTLNDLLKHQGMTDFTKKFRKHRNKTTGNEVNIAKLKKAELHVNDMIFTWKTPATIDPEKPNKPVSKVNPSDFSIVPNPEKEYTISITIIDFLPWAKTKPEGEPLNGKDIKEVLEVANIQYWSDAPSFHWQGGNYNSTQLDASMNPTDISDPIWRKIQGDSMIVDKHLGGILASMGFFHNPMASMATKVLKDKGLL